MEDVLAEAEGYHLILQEQVKKVNEVLDSSRIDERIKTETQVSKVLLLIDDITWWEFYTVSSFVFRNA